MQPYCIIESCPCGMCHYVYDYVFGNNAQNAEVQSHIRIRTLQSLS